MLAVATMGGICKPSGPKERKNTPGTRLVQAAAYIFILVRTKYEVSPKRVKSNERRKEDQKSVKTMASYTYNHHHRWQMQAAWAKSQRLQWPSTLATTTTGGERNSPCPISVS